MHGGQELPLGGVALSTKKMSSDQGWRGLRGELLIQDLHHYTNDHTGQVSSCTNAGNPFDELSEDHPSPAEENKNQGAEPWALII